MDEQKRGGGTQQPLPETMRAWRVLRFGGIDALRCEAVPVPQLQGDEVLVEVDVAALNPVDLKTLAGRYPMIAEADLPYTLGRDVAGVVAKATALAQGWAPGTRVCAFVGQGQGTLAEYVAVSASALAKAPPALDTETAAAVPLASLTAWQGLFDHGKLERGERVLILGASGPVGRFAVQFAHQCGARVVATASAATHDALRSLGASELIDYRQQRVEDATGDIDLVFDLVGGEAQTSAWRVLKRGGTLVSALTEPSQVEASDHGAHAMRYTARPDGAQLDHIIGLLLKGALKVEIVERFAFDAMPDAFARLERGHPHGKLLVTRR